MISLPVHFFLVIYLRQRRRNMFLPAFVCLSVRLSVSKITQKRLHGFGWNVACRHSTDVRTWTNWLTFQPDPDYSPDAGTKLLSPISYALQRGILLRRENPTCRYWYTHRSLQRRVVLKWFYSPRAVGTTCRRYMRSTHGVPFLNFSWRHAYRFAIDVVTSSFLCFCHCRLAGGIMFSTCLSVRPSVTTLVNTIFWKRVNWSWHKWSMGKGDETVNSEGLGVGGKKIKIAGSLNTSNLWPRYFENE